MTERVALIDRFLSDAGWDLAKRSNLAGDASNRSYDRLVSHGKNAVLMNAPPGKGEDIQPFVQVTELLLKNGFSAPSVLAQDAENGLLLLEDFGDDLYARLCASNGALEQKLYSVAVDVLVALRRGPTPEGLPPYNMAVYLREARLLTEWYLPAATGFDVNAEVSREFDGLISDACQQVLSEVPVTVLRDYHSENLLWLPDRTGIARVGLLDYQDALAGHPAYDLVSLLEDARRDTSAELQREMIAHYIVALGVDAEEFQTAYNILGMQRNIKIIGIFARLGLRDGKAGYLDYLPRVWAHLQRDLTDPVLSKLRDWVACHVPEPTRAVQDRIREQINAA